MIAMAGKKSTAYATFLREARESRTSLQVNELFLMEELLLVATVLGIDISDCTTKRKIATKVNPLIAEMAEKESDKLFSKLKELAGEVLRLDTPDNHAAAKRAGSTEEDDEEGAPVVKKLRMDDEDAKMPAVKNPLGPYRERLYESTVTSDSEIYPLEVVSPLFATVREDLVAKWGKVAGEVFDQMQREDIKWTDDMKFEQGSTILKKLEEINVGKRFWPLFLSRTMLGQVNSAIVDTAVNKMAGARSLKESLREVKNLPTVYLSLSYSHGRKIRYRHLMVYLLRYIGMHSIKNEDVPIDLNMAEHMHLKHFLKELYEGCGHGGYVFGRPKGAKMEGARAPEFMVSEAFDLFLDETLAMLEQANSQISDFKQKYNKHMNRAFQHGRKVGYDEGYGEGTVSGAKDHNILVIDDDEEEV